MRENIDKQVVADFGREWASYDQTGATRAELAEVFDRYFHILPAETLSPQATGMDVGCGSGRWAGFVAPQVKQLFCVDASSEALGVAMRNLSGASNVEFKLASVSELPVPDESLDFVYSLGVLHHVPDTPAAVEACARKLKRGAPLLLYLYYALDNRPWWFRTVWRISDVFRRAVCRLPFAVKLPVTQLIAALVYWPLSRFAGLIEKIGLNPARVPLSFYRDKSFYTLRTDALDRFGTKLEQRFTRAQIRSMMEAAGLRDVRFSDREPYWCAVAVRA